MIENAGSLVQMTLSGDEALDPGYFALATTALGWPVFFSVFVVKIRMR